MTSRRQDPSATLIVAAIVALAGVAVVIAVRLVAIIVHVLGLVAQPLALAFGALGNAFREKTRELWTVTVTHPDRSMVDQQRLAKRAEAGDTAAMRDLLQHGAETLRTDLTTVADLHRQLHAALPTALASGQEASAHDRFAALDHSLQGLESVYVHAGEALTGLYDLAIAIWEHCGDQTFVARETVAALDAQRSAIHTLVQTETDRLTRVRNLAIAALAAAHSGSQPGQLLSAAATELLAIPSPDPWTAAITHLTEIAAKAPAPATVPLAA